MLGDSTGIGGDWVARIAEGRASAGGRTRFGSRGFTIVELLVVIATVAALLALLASALGATIGSARGVRCQMALRSVAFDFTVFADDQLHGDRGDDARTLGHNRFRLETFQESQYGLDEFWRWPGETTHTIPDPAGYDPMRCAEIRGPLTLRWQTPCSQGALSPSENVSFGFNIRLHWAEVLEPGGQPATAPVKLSSDIVSHGNVPLAWDVDGAAAARKGESPVFSGPTLKSAGPYENDQYWFPGRRHNRMVNVAFVDGHVAGSRRPLEENGWDWGYQPPR